MIFKKYLKPIQLTKTIKIGFNDLYPKCLKKALLLWDKNVFLFLERVSMDQNALATVCQSCWFISSTLVYIFCISSVKLGIIYGFSVCLHSWLYVL